MPEINTKSWSLEMPDDWQIEYDEECVSTWRSTSVGALQFSSARKDEPVTEDDLHSFSQRHLDKNPTLKQVVLGEFSGIELDLETEDVAWRHWYLRSGPIALFVTYNCDAPNAGTEDKDVDAVLSNLKRR